MNIILPDVRIARDAVWVHPDRRDHNGGAYTRDNCCGRPPPRAGIHVAYIYNNTYTLSRSVRGNVNAARCFRRRPRASSDELGCFYFFSTLLISTSTAAKDAVRVSPL